MLHLTRRWLALLIAGLALLALASGCNNASPEEKAHQKVCGAHRFRVLCKRCCKERGFARHSWVGRHKMCGCSRPWDRAKVKPSLRLPEKGGSR